MLENIYIACCASVYEPWDSLKSDADINNFDWKFFIVSLMVVFVLHKDHISELKSMDKVLNTWTHVSSSSPNILNKCDLLRVYF
jgi:hypothetical protein